MGAVIVQLRVSPGLHAEVEVGRIAPWGVFESTQGQTQVATWIPAVDAPRELNLDKFWKVLLTSVPLGSLRSGEVRPIADLPGPLSDEVVPFTVAGGGLSGEGLLVILGGPAACQALHRAPPAAPRLEQCSPPPSLEELACESIPALPLERPQEVDLDLWDTITSTWNSLNAAEKKLCSWNWVTCGLAGLAGRDALRFADVNYPLGAGPTRNNPHDALKHARWALGMRWSFSAVPGCGSTASEWALRFLAAHEDFPSNPEPERRMDWLNNLVGLSLWEPSLLSPLDLDLAVHAAWTGDLLQEWACPGHPTDPACGCLPPADQPGCQGGGGNRALPDFPFGAAR
ncbi:MAG: hypothetical protein R3362_05355 [Rhodothermales bacterium]|nr:hypothetical protein [Rhodothermales bacterium]